MSESLQVDTTKIINKIAAKLQVRPSYVANVINLMKDGATVHFIARYRKEMTGAMDENEIRTIKDDYEKLYKLEERKIVVIQSIRGSDKYKQLSEDKQKKLIEKIKNAVTLVEVEDLYLPYKPKRKTLATKALEKGLGPLAEIIKEEREGTEEDRKKILARFITAEKDKESKKPAVKNEKEAISGAIDIIAEEVGQNAEFRKIAREMIFDEAIMVSKVDKKYAYLLKDEKKDEEIKVESEKVPEDKGVETEKEEKKEKEEKTEDGKTSRIDRIKALKEKIARQKELLKKEEEERKKRLEMELLRKQKKILKELSDEIKTSATDTLESGETDPLVYEMYFDFQQRAKELPPHRILAMNRGEKEKVLNISFISPDDKIISEITSRLVKKEDSLFHKEYLRAIELGYKRYIKRSIERELRSELTKKAEEHAIQVYARNLKSLLMQPPLKDRAVIALDPGYTHGTKVAVLDKHGKFLEDAIILKYKNKMLPKAERERSKRILFELMRKYNAYTFAIGNGTASRETEMFIASLAKEEPRIEYVIVNEAGASVYSTSKIAQEEFPDLSVEARGAISIGRRLQDPLSELIKIDPKSMGVGLYQHDVNQTALKKALDAVIEDCVNSVGVIVNTASYKLLEYVSGLNKKLARAIYDYRLKHGPFKSREELKKVPGIGEKTFEQCAGFIKILDGDNPLDRTIIHPESYWIVEKLLEYIGETPDILKNPSRRSILAQKIRKIKPKEFIEFLGKDVGLMTLKDIVLGLLRPDRDPRDDLPKPILRRDVLTLDDLKVGMILKGTVRNVVDFGAFVDIGVHEDGLVHISEMVRRDGKPGFISDPLEVLSVGDIIDVRVIGIDKRRKRISLSMRLNPEEDGKRASPSERKGGYASVSSDPLSRLERMRVSGNIIIKQKKKK